MEVGAVLVGCSGACAGTTSVPITSRIATILASMSVGGQVAFAVGGVNQSSQCCEMNRAAKNMPSVQC